MNDSGGSLLFRGPMIICYPNYIFLVVPQGRRHLGEKNTSMIFLYTTNGRVIRDYVTIHWPKLPIWDSHRLSELIFKSVIAFLLLVPFISFVVLFIYFSAFTKMNLLQRVGLPFKDHDLYFFSPLYLPLILWGIYCTPFLSIFVPPSTVTRKRATFHQL